MPFLENVTKGARSPRAPRGCGRALRALRRREPHQRAESGAGRGARAELLAHGVDMPIYVGNRNWHPFLADTIRDMAADGVERALAFFTSGFSSYSSCRQYRENIHEAQTALGDAAPEISRLRAFYSHPGFVQAGAELLRAALDRIPASRRARAHVAFTAHSIPLAMARGCRYEAQLAEPPAWSPTARRHPITRWSTRAARLAAHALARAGRLRSPALPGRAGGRGRHLSPLGFASDHIEVLYDLDVEASSVASGLDLGLVTLPRSAPTRRSSAPSASWSRSGSFRRRGGGRPLRPLPTTSARPAVVPRHRPAEPLERSETSVV